MYVCVRERERRRTDGDQETEILLFPPLAWKHSCAHHCHRHAQLLVFVFGIRMHWKRLKKMLQALFVCTVFAGAELAVLVA